MESTGKYWRPIWYALEDAGFAHADLFLVNSQHVKMVPGRKSDVADSDWLAQLLECGLLRRSFVPPQDIRELRDLTRQRRKLVEIRASEIQRVESVLEDAQIKISSVTSVTLGVSARIMLDRLIAGERNPEVLAEQTRGRLRRKIADLQEALVGRFNSHHALQLRLLLNHIDYLDDAIGELSEHIDTRIAGVDAFKAARELLDGIVGIGPRAAEDIIAEIGVDMARFPTAAHLASWAKVCPALKESAGKRLRGRQPKGNRWLGATLDQCAWAASHTKSSFLGARFHRIARRQGPKRAARAVAHSILVIAWHLLSTGAVYQDPGADWYKRLQNPDRRRVRLVNELQQLGYKVTIEPDAAA